MMDALRRRWYTLGTQSTFWASSLLALFAFLGGVAANGYAIVYATERASNPVTDIVLSNIPAYDVDGFYVWGAVALIVFIVLVLLFNPKRIPFSLYTLGLFFLIRAVFISLTHVGPFPTQTAIQFTSNIGTYLGKIFISGDDLFFSAHTGAPFLMALVFWEQKPLRYIFILWSLFFGTTALLGHIHYSIDVASAFFISFGIYHIALRVFKREYRLFAAKE